MGASRAAPQHSSSSANRSSESRDSARVRFRDPVEARGFTQVANLVVTDVRLDVNVRFTYILIKQQAWDNPDVELTQADLARLLIRSRRQVQRYLIELVDAGLLTIECGRFEGQPNVYWLEPLQNRYGTSIRGRRLSTTRRPPAANPPTSQGDGGVMGCDTHVVPHATPMSHPYKDSVLEDYKNTSTPPTPKAVTKPSATQSAIAADDGGGGGNLKIEVPAEDLTNKTNPGASKVGAQGIDQTKASALIRRVLVGRGYPVQAIDQALDELELRLISGNPLTAPGSWCNSRAKALAEAMQKSAAVGQTQTTSALMPAGSAEELCLHRLPVGERCRDCEKEADRIKAGGWRDDMEQANKSARVPGDNLPSTESPVEAQDPKVPPFNERVGE